MFLDPEQYHGFILTDFDGTLAPHGTDLISDLTVTTIAKARQVGFGVVCVTGRTWGMTSDIAGVNMFDAIVFNDGASVYVDGQARTASTIEPDAAARIISLAAHYDLGLYGDGFGGFEYAVDILRTMPVDSHARILALLPKKIANQLTQVFRDFLSENALPVTVHREKPTGSGYDVLRFSPHGVDKVTGVLTLCGASFKFATAGAVGDHYNDEPLLAKVHESGGVPRVMGNAPEDLLTHIPRVPTVTDNGAAIAIQQMFELLG